jgi:N-acetylmuramoyl-L-alanine amidase
MALVAFLPFGPFGGEDEPAVPTPSATLPSILDTDAGGDDGDADSGDAPEAEQPQAGEGQAVVCIDPGHGGWDTGWNRTDQGNDPYSSPIVTEAEINLGMAYMLKADLEAEGMFVVLTRPSGAAVNLFDEDINSDGETRLNAENTEQAGDRDELQARINVCNEANADILISLHINGFDDREVRGYEIFYTAERDFGDQNAELSTLVYRQLDTALRDTEMSGLGRGANPDSDVDVVRHEFGTADNYIMTGPAVEAASIDPSLMPGTIVEAAFLSNDQDAAWIVQPDSQRLVVRAYRDGIMDYFERYPPE